jgi:hypothetical protein
MQKEQLAPSQRRSCSSHQRKPRQFQPEYFQRAHNVRLSYTGELTDQLVVPAEKSSPLDHTRSEASPLHRARLTNMRFSSGSHGMAHRRPQPQQARKAAPLVGSSGRSAARCTCTVNYANDGSGQSATTSNPLEQLRCTQDPRERARWVYKTRPLQP